MMHSALLDTDSGFAVLGLREALERSSSGVSWLESPPEPMVEKLTPTFLARRVRKGWIMGTLLMTTATKVSRTAQLPACWAPFAPAWRIEKRWSAAVLWGFVRAQGATHSEDEDAAEDCGHHDENASAEHQDKPGLLPRRDLRFPKHLHGRCVRSSCPTFPIEVDGVTLETYRQWNGKKIHIRCDVQHHGKEQIHFRDGRLAVVLTQLVHGQFHDVEQG